MSGNDTGGPESYAEIRDEVAKLCARFPGEYWRNLDAARAYPTEFVSALTDLVLHLPLTWAPPGGRAGYSYGSPPGRQALWTRSSRWYWGTTAYACCCCCWRRRPWEARRASLS